MTRPSFLFCHRRKKSKQNLEKGNFSQTRRGSRFVGLFMQTHSQQRESNNDKDMVSSCWSFCTQDARLFWECLLSSLTELTAETCLFAYVLTLKKSRGRAHAHQIGQNKHSSCPTAVPEPETETPVFELFILKFEPNFIDCSKDDNNRNDSGRHERRVDPNLSFLLSHLSTEVSNHWSLAYSIQ